MGGLRIAAGSFFANLFSMLLVVLVAQSIGLLVGATILHPRTAIAFCTVMMLCTMLVAGFYVSNMPVWIAWMKYTSFVWYGYNLLLKIEFSHRGYSCSDLRKAKPEVAQDTPWCSVAQGQLFEVDVDEAVTLEVCVLMAALLVLRWAVYQALKMKTTFRQRG
ncbi:ABC transporter domain-containing protein [Haematococcus lacustris]|uniref:ABC transporter domain-containing protein n=1 Tax=Haematococcus lacustris TaxID=44745 RepID=A0A699ZIV0_HAELA|nr:ABC transporter domain-containing protein [Haematococcus lacustris]